MYWTGNGSSFGRKRAFSEDDCSRITFTEVLVVWPKQANKIHIHTSTCYSLAVCLRVNRPTGSPFCVSLPQKIWYRIDYDVMQGIAKSSKEH